MAEGGYCLQAEIAQTRITTNPDHMKRKAVYFAKHALLPDGWARDVLLHSDASGQLSDVSPDTPAQQLPGDVQRLQGTVIPGMPNCHSHAHQRAMAGLGERASLDPNTGDKLADSFWTWRTVMYRYLERIGPDDLNAIARQLYLEMLRTGYTHVGEFQYLHHDLDGNPYADRAEMTRQCLEAAREVGIGFTALPVLYRYGGFGEQPSNSGQVRFINDAEGFCEIVRSLQGCSDDQVMEAVGIAPHSLRAVSGELVSSVLDDLGASSLAAVHIHVAEQVREVEDCLDWSGQRPVAWMLDHLPVDSQWCVRQSNVQASQVWRLDLPALPCALSNEPFCDRHKSRCFQRGWNVP